MLLRNLLPAIVLFIFSSCAPKIEFTAFPPVISKGDSVYLKWKIKGEPTLLFDQRKNAHPPNDSLEILEFTLCNGTSCTHNRFPGQEFFRVARYSK